MTRREDEVRAEKVVELRKLGIAPYPSQSWQRTHTAAQVEELFTQPDRQLAPSDVDPLNETLRLCGRIVSKRSSGKLMFMDLRDASGKIQLKAEQKKVVGDVGLSFEQMGKLLDTGDFIGVTGVGCRTQRGQLSIEVHTIHLLSKAISPFPDSYYTVSDAEMLRRHRELDLVAHPETYQRFLLRSQIIQSVRTYLYTHQFHEIETPILQAIYGGAEARPFITHHNALDADLYLRIAPELFLKRAICGGFERVFELGRVFRNEGIDSTHNPEFTSLEVYQAYGDYFDILALVEEVICNAAQTCIGSLELDYQGHTISLERHYDYSDRIPGFTGKHWQVKTMVEAVQETTGLDFATLDLEAAIVAAQKLGLELSHLETQSLGHLLYTVFDRLVESTLIQPTFIIDFPVEVSPLAKGHRSKPGFVERFELFIAGTEFSNGFSELNDPQEQYARFEEQVAQGRAGNDESHPMDEEFIRALELGMPTCAGMGIGIDRLVMLLTNTHSIRDVIMFPTMRPVAKSE
ncbi:MAG: lysine--tRNA ligase [Cyanobacteria bacterium]|nr:lysine--tRNA ligase [Cyanobacteriota bacterium]MDW8201380.1 lysine--tRNA ligase [Cyanobacteriota bacterium SKYGB_h_bin112]